MHYSALALAVAALTVGGQAFLIPPNVNEASIADDEFALLSLAGSNPNNRVLKAACKGCLADGKDGALIYDLVISNLDHPKFLLNGADLTPLDLRPGHLDFLDIDMPPPFLSVPLVPDSSTLGELALTDLKPSEVKVMYNSYTEMSTLGDGETVKLILEATSVDGRPIPRLNTEQIEVQIVREGSGKMVMLDAKVLPADDGSMVFAGPMEIFGSGEKKCGIFCEILEKVTKWGKKTEEKVSKWGQKVGAKIRPCGGKNAHGKVDVGKAEEKKEKEDEDIITIMPIPIPDHISSNPSTWRRPPHSRPYHRPHTGGEREGYHHARPWSHHHHPSPHHMTHTHSAASAVYKVFIQVLVPIAIGVVAGMLVSLMGMVVGHFAVLAYQKAMGAVRRKKCAPVVEVGDEEVAKGLLSREEYRDEEGKEAPPVYDAQAAQDEKQ
ncbi:hypothetical protein BGX38DRAFT_1265790 [Terfezia claveryi]|nr:hypothetical protein BGX38DRAFT_1265790 [Terfezia claveryi]